MIDSNIEYEASNKIKTEVINLYNITNLMYLENENRLFEIMEIEFLDKYYPFMQNNINEIEFQPIWEFKPEYVSYALYQTASYDYLILHANKITSKKELKKSLFFNQKLKYYNKNVIEELEKYVGSKVKADNQIIKTTNYLLYDI